MPIGREKISEMIGRSWRTIKRWEKEDGLPLLYIKGRPYLPEGLYELWAIKLREKGTKRRYNLSLK